MKKHTVFVFSKEQVKMHEFTNPMDAVKFYYLTKMNPSEQSHINLVPNDYEFTEFLPPVVLSFSGTFVNDYFVGTCKLEASDGSTEEVSGVIPTNEIDFSKWAIDTACDAKKQAITGLMLSGAREIGRNEHTCQTFFVIGDYMVAVDDMGEIRVSKPVSSWNESIDEVLYTYENPYHYENDQYEGF